MLYLFITVKLCAIYVSGEGLYVLCLASYIKETVGTHTFTFSSIMNTYYNDLLQKGHCWLYSSETGASIQGGQIDTRQRGRQYPLTIAG